MADEEGKKELTQAKMGLISVHHPAAGRISSLASQGENAMALDMILRDIGPIHQELSARPGKPCTVSKM